PEDMSPPAPDRGPPAGEALSDRLEVTDIEAPAGVQGGATSWRIWGRGSLGVAPVFTVPLPDCSTLVGYTSRAPEGLVAWALHLDAADRLIAAHRLADGLALRGLAAEPDGHFGALLWDDAGDAIHVRRFSPDGQALWSTELRNPDNRPDDFDIGDSRLAFGDGRYGAYYHVHSNTGHEGDTLKWVTTEGAERTGWGWGCSHSMSTVLRFHGELGQFLPVCVTDCFPGTNGDFGAQSQGGIYLNHRGPKVIDVDAGCNGSVAGEIGSLAPAAGGWALTFNAHQAPLTQGQRGYQGKNQDVGFVRIQGNNQVGAVVWLTTTPEDEADVSVARWGAAEFVVGWTVGGQGHRLARVDDAGRILEGPVDVSATARWGKRDDPFRQHVNGDVIWAWFDRGGDTALHIGRVRSGDACR
ncbi:MAG: hypothetical protein KC613_27355, partial [Myxococcales bacterium]|nr:hypothetical protein [Myxococcales bacterium]